jgi:hypothetical protein
MPIWLVLNNTEYVVGNYDWIVRDMRFSTQYHTCLINTTLDTFAAQRFPGQISRWRKSFFGLLQSSIQSAA